MGSNIDIGDKVMQNVADHIYGTANTNKLETIKGRTVLKIFEGRTDLKIIMYGSVCFYMR